MYLSSFPVSLLSWFFLGLQLLLAEQDRTLDDLASATERLNETALVSPTRSQLAQL